VRCHFFFLFLLSISAPLLCSPHKLALGSPWPIKWEGRLCAALGNIIHVLVENGLLTCILFSQTESQLWGRKIVTHGKLCTLLEGVMLYRIISNHSAGTWSMSVSFQVREGGVTLENSSNT